MVSLRPPLPHACLTFTHLQVQIGLLEACVVVEWHAQGGEKGRAKRAAGRVREAAVPFVEWLMEAERSGA